MIVSFDKFLNESYKEDKMRKKLEEFYDFIEKVDEALNQEGFTVIFDQYGKNVTVKHKTPTYGPYCIGMFGDRVVEDFTKIIESLPSFGLAFWRKLDSIHDQHNWMYIEWKRKGYNFVPSAIKTDIEKMDFDKIKNMIDIFEYFSDSDTEKKFLCAQLMLAHKESDSLWQSIIKNDYRLKNIMEKYEHQSQTQIDTIESLVHKVPSFDFTDMSTIIKTSRFGI